MSHTPTPWIIKPSKKPHGSEQSMDCAILDGDMEIIAECFEKVGRTSEGQFLMRPSVPNAAFIVQAVNSYEALVEALNESNEALKAWLHSYAAEDCDENEVQRYKQIVKDESGTLAYLARRFAMIKAALALAKGQP